MTGHGPYYDPNIPDKKCHNCGRPAALLGRNSKLFPEANPEHPLGYWPLCLECARKDQPETRG